MKLQSFKVKELDLNALQKIEGGSEWSEALAFAAGALSSMRDAFIAGARAGSQTHGGIFFK